MTNRTPLWQYLVLVLALIFSIIYALPNFYGDDPAVQVSGTQGAKVTEAVITQIKENLHKADLKYKSVKLENDNLLLVRFSQTEVQLKARDYIKATLGDQYTVALNLAPAAPHWLVLLHANPMKLGLDLRGGVHFLLAVDVDSVISKRIASDMHAMTKDLREQHLRYAGVTRTRQNHILIRFRDQDTLNKARTFLHREYAQWQFHDTSRGKTFEISGEITQPVLMKMSQNVIEQTMTVLRNRVNELGVTEPIVQQQGKNRIVVDLPGIQDAAQATQILGATATLEFHMVDSEHDLETAIRSGAPADSQLYDFRDGSKILLKDQILLKGSNITSATSGMGENGFPKVDISVSGREVSHFSRVTRENVGKRMAIVYVETKNISRIVNGKVVRTAKKEERVISAPVIQSALPSNFQITGLNDRQESNNLALLLRAGALPANIYPVATSVVGPSLGKENIDKGILAIEIGFIAIVIFMIVYYRLFGLIANLALAFNLVLIVAILSLMGATLTLPGIAGIVLTVGMAVDANVLINERIREELRNGMSPHAAILVGYERAFMTIVDANVTTLIVAVVLFALATGAVKGFAVTLTIGLIASMFTAITGTHAVVNLIYRDKKLEKISIGI